MKRLALILSVCAAVAANAASWRAQSLIGDNGLWLTNGVAAWAYTNSNASAVGMTGLVYSNGLSGTTIRAYMAGTSLYLGSSGWTTNVNGITYPNPCVDATAYANADGFTVSNACLVAELAVVGEGVNKPTNTITFTLSRVPDGTSHIEQTDIAWVVQFINATNAIVYTNLANVDFRGVNKWRLTGINLTNALSRVSGMATNIVVRSLNYVSPQP